MDLKERQFLEEKLTILEKKAKDFQKECDIKLENKNDILLCLPTGSGKTDRFLIWAIKILLSMNETIKVIITAPIKALSNQRFRELFLEGYNIGIETGDIKYNVEKCTFLCCTQEIATYKYVDKKYISIIDEFHYIYNEPSRARAYIDYIINSKSPYMFLCSATLGDINKIKEYIDRISSRQFLIYNNITRLTNLYYRKSIILNDIKEAFVVSFSNEECINNARLLRRIRKKINQEKSYISEHETQIVLKTATKYELTNNELILNALSGIAYYYGSMLPKERLFVSELFSKKIIDTVFGTDALALGVNFPIKNVILTSVRKSNKLISKNLFEQLSGRAGRYGLYDEGFVYYCDEFTADEQLEKDYMTCMKMINEDVSIKILPDIKHVLIGTRTIEEEIEYAKKYSTKQLDEEKLKQKMENILELIKNFDIEKSLAEYFFFHIYSPRRYKEINFDELDEYKVRKFKQIYKNFNEMYMVEFFENIAEIYNSELSALDNCLLLRDIICGFDLETILLDGLKTRKYETRFRELLQIRKHLNNLPEKYKNRIDLVHLDEIISNIDKTVFDIELVFMDNELFDVYTSITLKNLLAQEEKIKKVKQPVKNNQQQNKSKQKIKNQSNNTKQTKLFEEGSIIKEAGAPFGSPKFLVLLYTSNECILLNYNVYMCDTISLSKITDLSKYFKLDSLSREEYIEILIKCKANSETFLAATNQSSKDIKKIKRILYKKHKWE